MPRMPPSNAPTNRASETAEGLATCHALGHYSRILFMLHLLTLLRASPHGRVVTIFAGGMESTKIHLDDLNLEKTANFGLIQSQLQMCTMLSMAMEELAEENPAVAFIRQFPGQVNTGNLNRGWANKRLVHLPPPGHWRTLWLPVRWYWERGEFYEG